MKTIIILAGLCVAISASVSSEARSNHGGGSYSHERSARTFRTSDCKSDSCFGAHPSGRYVHPITPRKD
jgi:hypothetical protein